MATTSTVLAVVDRGDEAGRDRPVLEPRSSPRLGGQVGHVGVDVDTRHEPAAEAVRLGDGVVVDLVGRRRRRVEGGDAIPDGLHGVTVRCAAVSAPTQPPRRRASPSPWSPRRSGWHLVAAGQAPAPSTSCRVRGPHRRLAVRRLESDAYLPDEEAQHRGAVPPASACSDVRLEISGARSVVEHLDGQLGGEEVARQVRRNGFEGCWVIALGTNDAANVAVGSASRLQRAHRPDDGDHRRRPVRVGRRQDAARARPVRQRRTCAGSTRRWPRPTPATRSCRCTTGRASVADQWFDGDGIHYTSDGYAYRVRAHRRARWPRRSPALTESGQIWPAVRIVSIIRRMPST